MSIRFVAAVGLVLSLSACGDWQAPSWLSGDSSAPATVSVSSPAPTALTPAMTQEAVSPRALDYSFVMTTNMDGDPRPLATLRCGQVQRYAHLRRTQINRGAKPEADTISWVFDCVY